MHPKRYSQIDRVLGILDRSRASDFFKEDERFLFLFKKAERFTAALYLITGVFFDNEPLKWRIREGGTRLLKDILSFKEQATTYHKGLRVVAMTEAAHLFSLLDLAHAADLLTQMNASILKNELHIIIGAIEERKDSPIFNGYQPPLKESFFGIPMGIFAGSKAPEGSHGAPSPRSIQTVKGQTALVRNLEELNGVGRGQKDIYKGHIESRGDVLYKRTQVGEKDGITSQFKGAKGRPLRNQIKDERRESIISTIRQRGSATIKDLSVVITSCSEKTIQRLLIEMVQGGVLKREGRRRWSRYVMSDKQAPIS
ncbi:MAG: hypothetical protein AAB891_02245 [Patescibacteria group bacterium]